MNAAVIGLLLLVGSPVEESTPGRRRQPNCRPYELQLQLIPVPLGQGRRLFDHLPPDHVELDLLRTLEAPGVLHLRYRVSGRSG